MNYGSRIFFKIEEIMACLYPNKNDTVEREKWTIQDRQDSCRRKVLEERSDGIQYAIRRISYKSMDNSSIEIKGEAEFVGIDADRHTDLVMGE